MNQCAVIQLQGICKRRFTWSICGALLILWGQLESRLASMQSCLPIGTIFHSILLCLPHHTISSFSLWLLNIFMYCANLFSHQMSSLQCLSSEIGASFATSETWLKLDPWVTVAPCNCISFMSWPEDSSNQWTRRQIDWKMDRLLTQIEKSNGKRVKKEKVKTFVCTSRALWWYTTLTEHIQLNTHQDTFSIVCTQL